MINKNAYAPLKALADKETRAWKSFQRALKKREHKIGIRCGNADEDTLRAFAWFLEGWTRRARSWPYTASSMKYLADRLDG